MTLGPGLGSTGHLAWVTTNYIIQGTCERRRESVERVRRKETNLETGYRVVRGEVTRGIVSGTHLIGCWPWDHRPTQSQSLFPVTWSAALGPLAAKPSTWNVQLSTSPHFSFSAYSWIMFEGCMDCVFPMTQNSPLILPSSNRWLCPLPFQPSSGLNEQTP